ncbi:MarR family winged helix-turn-helix transcriptional regulator [Bacillus sp. EAC]|uniref:MarR family winged helix-turn-helix transcriptional regulator n=1 Tax=Bacillus sp. EAC TaxID=1978338 RepID=UPI000B431C06|nr:MarR family transcriptional regulator [Bacillus sp. EAC]
MADLQKSIEVYNSFFSVAKQLKRLTYQSATDLGITVHQLIILNTLRINPGISQKELTEKLFFNKSRVSLHIDTLVDKDLVKREVSEIDRRETKLYLTTNGEEIYQRYREESSSYKALGISLNQFTEEEIDMLLQMHSRIVNKL